MRSTLALSIISLCSVAVVAPSVSADVMKPPPAKAGPVVVNSVPIFEENTIWYMNPRFFNTIGQSFKVDTPFRLTAVSTYVNINMTLLTPKGIEMIEGPQGSAHPGIEGESRAVHREDWKFPVTLTVNLYRSDGPIPTQFDVRDGNWRLITKRVQKRYAYTDRALVTRFARGPVVGPGHYLVTWTMEDVPRNILSITFSGTQEGRNGELADYEAGTAYISYKGSSGSIFNQHTTKTLDEQVTGRNDWCRGDLQIWIMGRKVKPTTPVKLGKRLTGGTPITPYVPPVEVGTRCWREPHQLQPRL